MQSGWKFFERRPNDKVRDPIQGEFFAAETEAESFEALVRESIQNSLDAAKGASVRVRIGVGEASATSVAPFLADAWDHIGVAGNGLRRAPRKGDSCRFVVFEDFGTSGLEGDERATSQSLARKNGFFCFFRAEGVSEKEGDDRGRWGLGKTVFPKSSRMNAMFGYTVRASDGKRLLMGNIALKTRTVGSKEFTPDGWFGGLDASGTVVPSSDAPEISAFQTAFSLARSDEPGLSVVIPFIDTDMELDDIARALEREVARSYFIPILRGQLHVEVVARVVLAIDTTRIKSLCETASLPADEAAIVRLALESEHASTGGRSRSKFVVPQCETDRHDWTGFGLDESRAGDWRSRLERGEIIDFSVPVRVFQRDPAQVLGAEFTVLLARDETVTKSVAKFVREGITVTKERKAPAQSGLVALVEIGPGALASALGDAENPAHTQWNPKSNSGRMKERYTHAPALLEYVRQAPHAIAQAIYRHAAPDDDRLLADFFPQDLLEEARPVSSAAGKRKPKKVGPPPAPPTPRPRVVRIESGSKGEFAVLPGGASIPEGTTPRVRIRVAYDRQTGNPLAKWNPADFVLSLERLRARKGLTITRCESNQIEFEIKEREFELRVGGFDERRDLFIASTVSEVTIDPQD